MNIETIKIFKIDIELMTIREEIRTLLKSESEFILPPWLAFPKIDQNDMFWRMGFGESYLSKWAKFYLKLEDTNKYQSLFPVPLGWEEFYD